MENYVKLRFLGKGGFGEVNLVIEKASKKQYAMKFIPCDMNPVDLERAKTEAECYKTLIHPNIVVFKEQFMENLSGHDNFVIVMEYYKEGSLRDVIKKLHAEKRGENTLSETRITRWSIQLCQAVEFLHKSKLNIVHRDIKPENILLTVHKELVLTDFGIAKVLGEQFNKTVSLIGTVYYMPPECWTGSKVKGDVRKWDMWSVGVVIHEMASLALPFPPSSAIADYDECVKTQKHPPLPAKYGSLQDVVDGLLKKDPSDRMDATNAIQELKQLLMVKSSFCDHAARIIAAEMTREMQQEAVDVAVRAMEKYSGNAGDVAGYIQEQFQKKHPTYWNCIAGPKEFGTRVTYKERHMIKFTIGNLFVLLFKMK